MNNCSILIKTVADGVDNTVTYDGEFSVGETVAICYLEKNAKIRLTIENGCARVVREGDYGMDLSLVPCRITAGIISLGGNQGEIRVQTERVEYRATENAVRVHLQYTLLIGNERQAMQLWISAKERK